MTRMCPCDWTPLCPRMDLVVPQHVPFGNRFILAGEALPRAKAFCLPPHEVSQLAALLLCRLSIHQHCHTALYKLHAYGLHKIQQPRIIREILGCWWMPFGGIMFMKHSAESGELFLGVSPSSSAARTRLLLLRPQFQYVRLLLQKPGE